MNYPLTFPLAKLFYKLGFQPVIRIDVIQDTSAGVYIATSKDLPGLIIEVDTIDAMRSEVKEAVVTLLKLNHQVLNHPQADLIYKDHIAIA